MASKGMDILLKPDDTTTLLCSFLSGVILRDLTGGWTVVFKMNHGGPDVFCCFGQDVEQARKVYSHMSECFESLISQPSVCEVLS